MPLLFQQWSYTRSVRTITVINIHITHNAIITRWILFLTNERALTDCRYVGLAMPITWSSTRTCLGSRDWRTGKNIDDKGINIEIKYPRAACKDILRLEARETFCRKDFMKQQRNVVICLSYVSRYTIFCMIKNMEEVINFIYKNFM